MPPQQTYLDISARATASSTRSTTNRCRRCERRLRRLVGERSRAGRIGARRNRPRPARRDPEAAGRGGRRRAASVRSGDPSGGLVGFDQRSEPSRSTALASAGGPRQLVAEAPALVIAIATPTGTTTTRCRSGSPAPASTATSPPTAPAPTATCSRPTSRRRSSTASASASPSQMSGRRSAPRARSTRPRSNRSGARMAVISHRRGPVIGCSLLAWLALLALAVARRSPRARAGPGRRPPRRPRRRLPAAGAAGRRGARTGGGRGSAAGDARRAGAGGADPGGAARLPGARRRRGLTVLAYALDAIAGSPLTALSLLGPNPGLGVRFYGIGNELEALLAVLVVGGIGAALAGFAPRLLAAPLRRRLPRRRPALRLRLRRRRASAPTSARRSSSRSAPRSPRVAVAGGRRRRGRPRRRRSRSPSSPCSPWSTSSPAPTPTSPARCSTPAGCDALGDVAQRRLQLSRPQLRPARSCSSSCRVVAALVGARRSGGATGCAPGSRGSPAMRAGLIGAVAATAGRHPRQRFRRPPARDRRRLSAGVRRLRLGRGRQIARAA